MVQATYKWEFAARRQTISTWRQEKKIGCGVFGSVWLEREEGRGKLRAVKKLSRDFLPGKGFLQELLALSKLKYVSIPEHF